MISSGYPSFLMFVAGEPDNNEPVVQAFGFWQRLGTFMLPPALLMTRPGYLAPVDPNTPPWRIVKSHAGCIEMVAEIATQHQRVVRVVDVNLAGEDRDLVREFVNEQDVLPVLVRLSDRSRLEGLESFSRAKIERFVAQG